MAKDQAAVVDLCLVSQEVMDAISELLRRLSDDHVREAEGWFFPDQRRDYIAGKPNSKSDDDEDAGSKVDSEDPAILQGALARYWSNPILRSLFPAEFETATTRLGVLLSEANAWVAQKDEERRKADANTARTGGTFRERKRRRAQLLLLLACLNRYLALKKPG